MSYQLPEVKTRVYTGDEVNYEAHVHKTKESDNNNNNSNNIHNSSNNHLINVEDEVVDTAFVRKVARLLSTSSNVELESMKSNVSPVLRWVALMHDKCKENNIVNTSSNKVKQQEEQQEQQQEQEEEELELHKSVSMEKNTVDAKKQISITTTTTSSEINDANITLSSQNNNNSKNESSSESLEERNNSNNNNNNNNFNISKTNVTSNNSSVLSALSRRGVSFKDPLIERMKRRMLKQEQHEHKQKEKEEHISTSKSTEVNSKNTTLSYNTLITTLETQAASCLTSSHWTQRRLSEMQSSSWAIFREQVGIIVEVYNRRHNVVENSVHPEQSYLYNNIAKIGNATKTVSAFHLEQEQVEMKQSALQTQIVNSNTANHQVSTVPLAPPRFTVDTIHPIRCWEEARLPYALGKCVNHLYGFPTAVQCMCVSLANATLQQTASYTIANTCNYYNNSNNITTNNNNNNTIHKIDVLAVAETGSGKTAAYIIPILTDILLHRPKLLDDPERISLGPFSLVLVPTRELAEQVTREFNNLLHAHEHHLHHESHKRHRNNSASVLEQWEEEELAFLVKQRSTENLEEVSQQVQKRQKEKEELEYENQEEELIAQYKSQHNMLSEIRVVKVTGGESTEVQFAQLSRGAHVVIGTVGQLNALLQERLLSLGNTQMVVIDEADRMIDDDQSNSLQRSLIEVLDRCPVERQTLLFTATLKAACSGIAKKYFSQVGYYIIRTPQRCASIVQNFEVVPSTPLEWVPLDNSSNNNNINNTNNNNNKDDVKDRHRELHRLIHPTKFNRLVSWLVYCPSAPIVIFANEKKVCDALQEELRNERAHLHELEQEFDIYTLLGPSPYVSSSSSFSSSLLLLNMTNKMMKTEHKNAPITNKSNINTNQNEEDDNNVDNVESSIIEVQTRKQSIHLDNLSSVAVIHSELSQNERQRLVQLLHRGERKVLITTDLLARGLDLPHVSLVINYDLPWGNRAMYKGFTSQQQQNSNNNNNNNNNNSNDGNLALTQYIHRIGRTGRAGEKGTTVSFITLSNNLVQRAMRVMNKMSNRNNNNSYRSGNNNNGNQEDVARESVQSEQEEQYNTLSRRIFAPGTSQEAKIQAMEKVELTEPKRNKMYGNNNTEFDGWEDFGNDADDDNNDESEINTDDDDDDENENNNDTANKDMSMEHVNGEAGGKPQRSDKRKTHPKSTRNSIETETITFASDEAILAPM